MKNEGVALTVVLIIVTVLSILIGGVLATAYNQKLSVDRVNARHVRAEMRARAGVVDARWRIRTNHAGLGGVPQGGYEPGTDPAPYQLDVDGDGTNDVTVDIAAESTVNSMRVIEVTAAE